MSAQDVNLVSLAETISETAKALAAQLRSSNLADPTFAEDSLDYPKHPEVIGLRFQLLDAVNDMHRLAMGPHDMAFLNPLFLNHDVTILTTLNQFDFWNAVPLGGSATYAEIANKTSVPEGLVRRLLKYAMTIRVFAPASLGSDSVVHTSLSAVYVKQPALNGWLVHNFEEVRPASLHLPESIRLHSLGKEKVSEDPYTSGFVLANVDRLPQGGESYWDYLKRDAPGKPKGFRAAAFSQAMQTAAANLMVKTEDLLRLGFDWGKLGAATIVDVGGSSGDDALSIAKHFPDLKFVVQDLPEVAPSFEAKVPSEFRDRIRFEAHDFFTSQTVEADVYMLKMILHDWPNGHAIKILKNLVPHLKPGKKILLVETVAPPAEAPLPIMIRRGIAASDMQMLTAFNAQERDGAEWKELIAQVDEKLEITNISQVPGAMHNCIEVTYQA